MKTDKLFNKLLFLSLLIVFTASATPPYMWYATVSIEDYAGNGCSADQNLQYSHDNANGFRNAIIDHGSNINNEYLFYNWRDDQALAKHWNSQLGSINDVDFLYFAGHGSGFGPHLGCTEEFYELYCMDIVFTKYLKWVQAAACMWFCPPEYVYNRGEFARWSESFQGVHTVQGHRASSYEWGWNNGDPGSALAADLFWDLWVDNGYSIHGAWRNSQFQNIYIEAGAPGLVPATMAPNVSYGTETFSNAGDEAAPYGATWLGYASLGDPEYGDPTQ